jgi:hypothetical protein
MFTGGWHWAISWTSRTCFTSLHPASLWFILITSHLDLSLHICLCSSRLSDKNVICISDIPIAYSISHPSYLPWYVLDQLRYEITYTFQNVPYMTAANMLGICFLTLFHIRIERTQLHTNPLYLFRKKPGDFWGLPCCVSSKSLLGGASGNVPAATNTHNRTVERGVLCTVVSYQILHM